MDSYRTEPLTQQSAAAIARRWIDYRIEKPTKAYAWSQMRWFMDQLASRCIAESLRCGEDEDDLYQRLDNAYDIISDLLT